MAGLRKKRRIQLIVLGLGFMVVAAALIGYGFRDGISLYRSTSDTVAAAPGPEEVFRMGGMVVEGSIDTSDGLRFEVSDLHVAIPVVYTGADQVPDLFGDCQGTVLTGRYVDGVFEAETILTKHDETYMPAEVVDDMQGVDLCAEGES